jgi:hypothetical protein
MAAQALLAALLLTGGAPFRSGSRALAAGHLLLQGPRAD